MISRFTILAFFVFILFEFIPISLYSQNNTQLGYTSKGFNSVVYKYGTLSASELYQKCINWVQRTYKTPNLVLKGNIPNEQIRIEAYQQDAIVYRTMGILARYDVEYTLIIDIKDGKVRFSCMLGQIWKDGVRMAFTYKWFFKSNGKIRKMYKEVPTSLERSIGGIIRSFDEYITSKPEEW